MTNVIQFFNSWVGRLLRVALGLVLFGYGLFGLGGTAGAVIAVVGLAPIGLGVWGHCLSEFFVPGSARVL